MNPDASPVRVPPTSFLGDLIHAILGIIVVTAVYADGRAHIMGLPDSFFTPWHAFLYGGLALVVLWLGIVSWSAARHSAAARPLVIPTGYRPAAAGAIVFAVGGLADMLWHSVFGVEFGIDALLSPSHLLLFVGGGLLLSGPVLAFREREASTAIGRRIPALLSVIGITTVAAFALSFLSAFLSDVPTIPLTHEPEGTQAHIVNEGLASAGLGSFVITTLLLVAPAVYLLRSRIWFVGAITALVTATAAYAASLTGFQNPASIISAFIAGALVDVVVLAVRSGVPERGVELIAAVALPALVWPGQLATIGVRYGLGWSEEMIIGVVLLSAAISFTVVLIIGPGKPRTSPTATPPLTPARRSAN